MMRVISALRKPPTKGMMLMTAPARSQMVLENISPAPLLASSDHVSDAFRALNPDSSLI